MCTEVAINILTAHNQLYAQLLFEAGPTLSPEMIEKLLVGLAKDFAIVLLHQLFYMVKFLFDVYNTIFYPTPVDKANVKSILWRHKPNYYACSSPDQFIAIHKQLCNPETVLDETVSLFSVDQNEATFVRMPKPIQEYSADKVPFIWMWLYRDSTEVIQMPIEMFHQLADKIGPPKDKVIICSHAGRVGSTLLAHMVQRLSPEVFSFSSHHSFYCLHNLKKLQLEKHVYKRLVRSTAYLTFKPIQGKTVFFTKGPCKTVDISYDLLEVLPNSAHIFITRNAEGTIRSYEKVFTKIMDNRWMFVQLNIMKAIGFQLFNLGHYHPEAQRAAMQFLEPTLFELYTMVWASFQLNANDIQDRTKSLTISFESITAKDPNVVMKAIGDVAELTGLENANLAAALKAKESDSQKGTVYCRGSCEHSWSKPVTPQMKLRIAAYCEAIDILQFDWK